MKQLNLIGFFATVILLILGCCKEPEPCNPSYFADVTLKEKQGIEYTLLIDGNPADSWKGDTASIGRTIDISERYTGVPADFRVRAFIDLGGPNIDGIFYYSDVYRDSVRVPTVPKLEIKDQSTSGLLSIVREGNRNNILVRNALPCGSMASIVYNGKETQTYLEAGSDFRFENNDSTFNITFQLLTPCEFYPRELMKVSSSKIQEFNINQTLAVRKEDCGIKKIKK